MIYRLLADLTVLLHFGFILFALMGGVLVSRWSKLVFPCMGWIAINQFVAWRCPLTLVEKFFQSPSGNGRVPGRIHIPLCGWPARAGRRSSRASQRIPDHCFQWGLVLLDRAEFKKTCKREEPYPEVCLLQVPNTSAPSE